MKIKLRYRDKYYKDETVFNEDYGEILDFAIKTILNKKIKTIRFGSNWQYLMYNGKVRAYLSKRKRRNQKSLIIKGDNLEIECLIEYWDEIVIKDNEISIEEVGLFFTFQNPIYKDYKKIKELLG
jgi:methionine synthase II (cobalamin-independent)